MPTNRQTQGATDQYAGRTITTINGVQVEIPNRRVLEQIYPDFVNEYLGDYENEVDELVVQQFRNKARVIIAGFVVVMAVFIIGKIV